MPLKYSQHTDRQPWHYVRGFRSCNCLYSCSWHIPPYYNVLLGEAPSTFYWCLLYTDLLLGIQMFYGKLFRNSATHKAPPPPKCTVSNPSTRSISNRYSMEGSAIWLYSHEPEGGGAPRRGSGCISHIARTCCAVLYIRTFLQSKSENVSNSKYLFY